MSEEQPPQSSISPPPPDEVIDGKYRIVRLIGEGGMGAVFEGENVRIHRRVAIKVLHAGIASNDQAVMRFEREAQAAGRIGSEHIVEVLDLGNLPNGERFMVMEFLEGESLSDRIAKRGRLAATEAYYLGRQVLEGLGAAHAAEIIHRDLKPDNVFLLKSRAGQQDFVKLLDFGISKFSALSGDSNFSMTSTGAVMGTPYYMSPEQAKGGKNLDNRADLYSVGVILFECVTGRVPFQAETFNELMFKIVLEEAPAAISLAPDLEPAFSALIAKSMARNREERFQSAREFQEALDEWAAASGVAVNQRPTYVGGPADPRVAGLSQSGSGVHNLPQQAVAAAAAETRPGTLNGSASWANTQGDAPRSRPMGLIIGAAVGGLVVFGAIAAVAVKLSGGSAAAAPSPDVSQTAAPVPEPAETPAPTETAAPPPSATPAETAAPTETAAAPTETAAPKPTSPPKVAGVKATAKPTATAAPTATAKPDKPPTAPTGTSTGGRVIRDTL